MLTALKTSRRQIPNRRGYLPPELRPKSKGNNDSAGAKFSFKTEIFQLGYILWLLAEHKSNICGYLCKRSACATVPCYSCTAEHTKPICLPTCSGGIPAHFNEIIKSYRSADPRQRASADKLLAQLHAEDFDSIAPGIEDVATKFSLVGAVRFSVYYNECSALAIKEHYHCNVFNLSNFDIRATCINQGIHCFIPEHHLTKRVLRNGVVVDDT